MNARHKGTRASNTGEKSGRLELGVPLKLLLLAYRKACWEEKQAAPKPEASKWRPTGWK
jgi:hypothetical protein